ncbi:MAG TPA: thrombospondin type 3 repeat-containing protein [Myxococcota bacterium]|nr:thrombospondin type 3 repeat-containing protein [Myxococcota bacterium]
MAGALALWMVGCAVDREPAAPLPSGAVTPPVQRFELAPSAAVALTGAPLAVEARGVPPGAWVTLLGSANTTGPGICPPGIRPTCADIAAPFVTLGVVRADASGRAVWSLPIPPSAPPEFEMQAWAAKHGTIYLSNGALVRTLAPQGDEDGDALTNARELDLGTDPFAVDTDGGCADDGREVEAGTDPLDPADDAGEVVAAPASVDLFGQIAWFADGASLPAGRYRVSYVDGCMRYNPSQGWAVHAFDDGRVGWWMVGATAAERYAMAPGTIGYLLGEGAYATFDACVEANLALPPVELDLPGGPLGIWLADNPYVDNVAGEDGRSPQWRVERVDACR